MHTSSFVFSITSLTTCSAGKKGIHALCITARCALAPAVTVASVHSPVSVQAQARCLGGAGTLVQEPSARLHTAAAHPSVTAVQSTLCLFTLLPPTSPLFPVPHWPDCNDRNIQMVSALCNIPFPSSLTTQCILLQAKL